VAAGGWLFTRIKHVEGNLLSRFSNDNTVVDYDDEKLMMDDDD
jgi:hypothetical protein